MHAASRSTTDIIHHALDLEFTEYGVYTSYTPRKDHLEAVSISASATQREKPRALKEIEKINKMIAEMEEYERDVLYPLATEQVEIDLDDGVKVELRQVWCGLEKDRRTVSKMEIGRIREF